MNQGPANTKFLGLNVEPIDTATLADGTVLTFVKKDGVFRLLPPSGGGGAVTSVFTRTGAVVAAGGDYSVGQVTGAAPLASPALTGTPTTPTAGVGTNTTQIASTAFVLANAGNSSAKYIVGDSPVPAGLTNARSWPGLYNHPDIPPASANAMDDEFDTTFNLSGIWTVQNAGSLAAANAKSWLGLSCVSNGGAHNWRGYTQPAPATPWEFTAKISLVAAYTTAGSDGYVALIMRESGTGKLITFNLGESGSFGGIGTFIQAWTSFSAFVTGLGTIKPGLPSIQYYRVKNDGTNLFWSTSVDGANFQQFYTEAQTAHFTTAPNQVGLFINPYNDVTLGGCEWFRRTL